MRCVPQSDVTGKCTHGAVTTRLLCIFRTDGKMEQRVVSVLLARNAQLYDVAQTG